MALPPSEVDSPNVARVEEIESAIDAKLMSQYERGKPRHEIYINGSASPADLRELERRYKAVGWGTASAATHSDYRESHVVLKLEK